MEDTTADKSVACDRQYAGITTIHIWSIYLLMCGKKKGNINWLLVLEERRQHGNEINYRFNIYTYAKQLNKNDSVAKLAKA